MTQAGTVYGESLYSLAAEEDLTKTILHELLVLKQSFAAEPDFIRLMDIPNLPKAERCDILDDSFRDKVEPYLLNFMKILTEKGYIRHFDHCCQAYRDCFNRAHDILPVTATSALPLNSDQQQRLRAKLATLTGKTVELTNKVDVSVLGGIRLDYDGKQVDDTVRHRMDAVRDLLQNTVL